MIHNATSILRVLQAASLSLPTLIVGREKPAFLFDRYKDMRFLSDNQILRDVFVDNSDYSGEPACFAMCVF